MIGHRVHSISVVLTPERRVRREVGSEIDLTQRHVNKRVQAAAHVVLVDTEALQVHDEDVRGSP